MTSVVYCSLFSFSFTRVKIFLISSLASFTIIRSLFIKSKNSKPFLTRAFVILEKSRLTQYKKGKALFLGPALLLLPLLVDFKKLDRFLEVLKNNKEVTILFVCQLVFNHSNNQCLQYYVLALW